MRGPYERLKYDLRRLWECPQCHRQTRTAGDVVVCFCKCQKKLPRVEQVCMKLVGDGPQRVADAPTKKPMEGE